MRVQVPPPHPYFRCPSRGRVYGEGFTTWNRKNWTNVPVPEIAALFPDAERPAKQAELFAELAV